MQVPSLLSSGPKLLIAEDFSLSRIGYYHYLQEELRLTPELFFMAKNGQEAWDEI